MEPREQQEQKEKNHIAQNYSKALGNNKAKDKEKCYKGKAKLSPEEREHYRKDNKCFKCGEPGHVSRLCPKRSEHNEPPTVTTVEALQEDGHCKGSPLFYAWEILREHDALMLFDPGSTHNFIFVDLTTKLGILDFEMGDAMKADGAFKGHKVLVTPLIGKLRLNVQESCGETKEEVKMSELLNEFQDVLMDDIPSELPPTRGQDDHTIELLPGSSLPNKAPYRVSHAQQEEILRQVNELIEKGMPLPPPPPKVLSNAYTLFFDGAFRRATGKVGGGLVLVNPKGEVVMKEQVTLDGSISNNEAEYDILISGLKICLAQKIRRLMVKGDALLIVKQILGIWACKNERLKTKVTSIRKLFSQFEEVQLYHIPRKENEDADLLAQQAVSIYRGDEDSTSPFGQELVVVGTQLLKLGEGDGFLASQECEEEEEHENERGEWLVGVS
ncbi:hypothetical protein L7F22_002232 [Adiantum nelumboides]|nr:hypothetical protein [Adiantum nelumboides]